MEQHELAGRSAADGRSFKVEKMTWGVSSAMQTLRRILTDTASKDIPILIVGESGTGKSLLATHIHSLSDHCEEPFVRVNCQSFDQEHAAASLRPANSSNGTVSLRRGTIFLDNVCELELNDQRRLLGLLPEEGASSDGSRGATRVISTARRTLDQDLRTGKFLEDLYFRLNGVCLRIPPLRERKEDILDLADFFLSKYAELFERGSMNLDEEVLARLAKYSWPGNVRQLEQMIKRIVATGDVHCACDDLVEFAENSNIITDSEGSLKKAVRKARRQVERELIARALTKTNWNRKRAAQELHISYKSLLSKMKQIGVDD